MKERELACEQGLLYQYHIHENQKSYEKIENQNQKNIEKLQSLNVSLLKRI